LWQRPAGSGRMAEFWELPEPAQLPGLRHGQAMGTVHHTITHHRYTFQVIGGEISRPPKGFHWIAHARLREIPLSTIARKALRLSTHPLS
jgi:adenine-specific DNA glycosylase